MGVVVANCTIEDLFNGKTLEGSDNQPITGSLCIPEYQRPYCWSKVQLQKLVHNYYELHDTEEDQLKSYYIGSIIIHREETGNGFNKLNIIDGQQRLTSLFILAYTLHIETKTQLFFSNPLSQQQIQTNILFLSDYLQKYNKPIDFSLINVTLVVTESQDDAYRFFENQNTGGVPLSGPDIIKAHHLRSIDGNAQDTYATLWESLGNLNPICLALLRGRYWNFLNFRELPPHRKSTEVREQIISELGTCTINKPKDISYGRYFQIHMSNGESALYYSSNVYDVRQPLHVGINTIHYLSFFNNLHKEWLLGNKPGKFSHFYKKLIMQLGGCSYLQNLYDTCLLMVVSQFGSNYIYQTSVKLFRVIYSPRVSNEKSVKENTIPAFLRSNHVLDWIANSFTIQELWDKLDRFNLQVDPKNLNIDSYKRKFIIAVLNYFEIKISEENIIQNFSDLITKKISQMSFSEELDEQ